jgi:TonB family protein
MRFHALIVLVCIAAGNTMFAQKPSAVSTMPASAALVNAPRPSYPNSAKKHGIGGAGVFVLHVDRHTGLVSSVSVQKSTGSSLLDRCGTDAFRKWRFKPDTIGPKIIIPLTFVPDNSSDAQRTY